ncbi:MAG: thioredoxin domain-containing protein [Gammaproteobacteria bacterium]|nr:thioredoxin domain-containing protein [Gammaproteobacteria bacterium]
MTTAQNRLASETSPYLAQHADNPVEWYPWGEEALAKAKAENKPILLSIGYSACHWCHVMAHESFEDEATAEVMNRLFINIKVDREERPDLDKIYQTAHYLLTRRNGGWPLTMFLTPDTQVPFFGGTYFPREPSHGMPAFTNLMERVALFHQTQTTELAEQSSALLDVMRTGPEGQPGARSALNAAPLEKALEQLFQQYDETHGGFGKAPKFPMASALEFCLQHWQSSGQTKGREMAEHALRTMAGSGLYDHLGGGFFRYAVDDAWTIPHFEKMLYDNGQLLSLYAAFAESTGYRGFDRILLESGNWIVREMEAPNGGYYSTLDADSEGEEGKYYLWTPDEAKALLSEEQYAVVSGLLGLDQGPNFENTAWHLQSTRTIADLATELKLSEKRVIVTFSGALPKLLAAREKRVRPGLDDKLLTGWNGLMIRGLAMAGRQLNEPRFTDSAGKALAMIRETFWQSGRLLATGKGGEARLSAYLDDYVLLIEAILELLQNRWRSDELQFAIELAEVVLSHFSDEARGGFYFTADDHERLIVRPKPFSDDALPAGNGIAARVLQRLGHLLGETRYLRAAEGTIESAWNAVQEVPMAHCALLGALDEQINPPLTLILRGPTTELTTWQQGLRGCYRLNRQIFLIPDDAHNLPELLQTRATNPDGVVAYLCRGQTCETPIHDLPELLAALAGAEQGPAEQPQ